MEKAGGRPRDEVWQHVKVLEGGRRVRCNYCKYEFAASANRIKSHINKDKGKGIRVCPNFPQFHNFASDNKGNSNHLKDNFLHSQGFSLDGLIHHRKSDEEGQIQGDAKYEERIQVGSSSVSNRENEYLQFFAMELLFKQKNGAFSDYQKEMANDILFQDNGFDCGVFVINYIPQSDNYVKRESSLQV
ncbi:hypothetical protein K1719_039878 [Acacia pycnantha]|nr:hypothetical protein K1719_039878 [Acacia pycnantha]